MPSQTVTALVVDPIVPQNVYLASPSGLFRSKDGGLTWVDLKVRLDSVPMALAVDPHHPATVFAVLASGTLLRSNDSGATWAPRKIGP